MITRRKQFRGRADWKSNKKAKAAANKVEAAKKKAEVQERKAQRKAEREQKKTDQEQAKKKKKADKEQSKKNKGQSAADKRKSRKSRKNTKSQNKTSKKKGTIEASPETEGTSLATKQAAQTPEKCTKVVKSQCSRLTKLRRYSKSWNQKELPVQSDDQDEADAQPQSGQAEMGPCKMGQAGKEMGETGEATEVGQGGMEMGETGEATKAGQGGKGRKTPKSAKRRGGQNSSEKKKKRQTNTKTCENECSKTKKLQTQEKEKKAKTKKSRESTPIDEDVKAQVLAVVQECHDSHCTHPSWENMVQDDRVQFSIYWTRCAVGVKICQEALPQTKGGKAKSGKKGQGKKAKTASKRQVAYFACPTTCTYSNLLLAHLYDPRLQCFGASSFA